MYSQSCPLLLNRKIIFFLDIITYSKTVLFWKYIHQKMAITMTILKIHILTLKIPPLLESKSFQICICYFEAIVAIFCVVYLTTTAKWLLYHVEHMRWVVICMVILFTSCYLFVGINHEQYRVLLSVNMVLDSRYSIM